MSIAENTILTLERSLTDIVREYTQHRQDKSGKLICPFCGSGTGADGTSAFSIATKPDLKTGRMKELGHCMACDVGGDWAKTIAIKEHLDGEKDFREIVSIACNMIGIPLETTETTQKSKTLQKTTIDTEKSNSFKNDPLKCKIDGKHFTKDRVLLFIESCKIAREKYQSEFNQYMKETRGLVDFDFLSSRFEIGVCNFEIREMFRDICSQSGIVRDSLILGYGKDTPYFFAREVNGEGKRKLSNFTEDGQSVPEPIFNLADFESFDSPIFLCEGQFDVLTMSYLGYFAIGLGGTPSKSKLDKIADLCREQGSRKTFIVMGDNDKGGERFAEIINKNLSAVANLIKFDWEKVLGIPPEVKTDISEIVRDIENKKTDTDQCSLWVNSIDDLLHKIDSFISQSQSEVSESIELAAESKQDYQLTAYDSHWVSDQFLADMIAERKSAISTGYPSLDRIMSGGLMPYLYIIGAIPSMGKSTICLNIADEIARSGTDVLYFSVEMSRSQLLQKSIARATYRWATENKKDIETHSSSIDEWLDPTEQQRDVLDKVMRYYRENIALHKITIDCTCDGVAELNALTIKNAVEKHIENTGRKPVVFVDYLQILADVDDGRKQESDKKKLDRSIKLFKSMSSQMKIPVVLISALNRSSYKGASLDSGSGSGGIEYSADELYTITPDRCHYEMKDKANKDLDDLALADICKGDNNGMYVYFKNLKNRMGKSQQKAKLILLGKYSVMVENSEVENTDQQINNVGIDWKKKSKK